MNIIELTKVVDWQNTRNDKKICIVMDNIMNFEEIPNAAGCVAIRYLNGSEMHVREDYKTLKEWFGV